MSATPGLMKDVEAIITHYFGSSVAGYYVKFYSTKTDDEVYDSCKRMLEEMIGPEKTKKMMAPLYEKYGRKGRKK